MAARGNSLRDKQIRMRLPTVARVSSLLPVRSTNTPRLPVSIKKILNLNETVEPSESNDPHSNAVSAPSAPISKDGNPIWKLLVFDVSSTRGGPPVTTDAARNCADWAPDRTLVAM